MRQQLIETEYQGINYHFTEDAWFNATEAADKFNKAPYEWLRLPATEKYLAAFQRKHGEIPYLKKKRGANGGTWLHPKLAVRFAQWLDDDFAVWCDDQIDSLIRGTHTHHDWSKLRHEAASSFKVMNHMLDISRTADGKPTKSHHYMNEAKLINWVVSGQFKGLDRDSLSVEELTLMSLLEVKNTFLIAQGATYKTRKSQLHDYAVELRQKRITH